MTLYSVANPYPVILGRTGTGINGGKVYIGVAGQDPETNPVAVYWDAAGTIPASQPLSTIGGYIWNAGSPAQVYGPTTYSIRVRDRTNQQVFYDANVSGPLSDFINLIESTDGAGLVGYDQSETYASQTVGYNLQASKALTPADFAHLVTGGKVANGQNDTPAFVALAAAYFAGRAIHFPDLGQPYLIDPDTVIFTPPASYNNSYRRPPSVTMDESAIVKCRTQAVSASFLVQFGTANSNFSGILRSPSFKLGIFDANAGTFSKGVLYFPFFLDGRFDYRVQNHFGRAVQFGDTSAPQPSAGIKGKREYDRDLYMTRRDSSTITLAANPVITFSAPHALWPSTGRVCVGLVPEGTPLAYNALGNTTLDALVISATQVQLLNVDTSAFPALSSGFLQVHLCLPSMRVSKRISGVTNGNPCVVTTAVPHLLTTGETVDLAEIGGMMPDSIRGLTGVHGQFVATVLTPTTFSIPLNTTNTATYGSYQAGLGPGLMMPWVPLAQCDIAEFRANATDADDSECYVKHVRVGFYNDPVHAGWDGKGMQPHFYSFPTTAELLCAYYCGGDNNFVQVQCDGPFRYVFWAFGPRNASSHTSTNCGYIDPRDLYGSLVRTESGASWNSRLDRMKGRSSYRMFTDHIGAGSFTCADNIYDQVYSPQYEFGTGKRAASVVFDGTNGQVKSGLQLAVSSLSRVPGGDAAGDWYIDFVRPVPLDAYVEMSVVGVPDAVVTEDFSWSQRNLFERRIRTKVAGAAVDVSRVSVTWRYP